MLKQSFFAIQNLHTFTNGAIIYLLLNIPDAAGELIKGTPKELTQREALRLKLKERKY